MHTLNMLINSKSDEERAAIWLYASTKEMIRFTRGQTKRIAYEINNACDTYLRDSFYMWHHAMTRLIPIDFISAALSDVDVEISSVNATVNLVAINTALICYEYVPMLYSSLKQGEEAPDISARYR